MCGLFARTFARLRGRGYYWMQQSSSSSNNMAKVAGAGIGSDIRADITTTAGKHYNRISEPYNVLTRCHLPPGHANWLVPKQSPLSVTSGQLVPAAEPAMQAALLGYCCKIACVRFTSQQPYLRARPRVSLHVHQSSIDSERSLSAGIFVTFAGGLYV